MRYGAVTRGSSRASALYLIGAVVLLSLQGCGEAATPTEQIPRPSLDVVDSDSGLVLTADSIPSEGHGSHQVIVTQSGGLECRKTTFEAGPHFAEIHPENGYLIPNANARFPGWRTLITGPVFNKPSPVTFAFWNTGSFRSVTFDQPVAVVSLFYTSRLDVTLTAYDASGTTLASDLGPANALPAFDTWNQVTVDVQQNLIARVTVQGSANVTAIDDFESCQIVVIEVEIDIKPGSDPNSINLGSGGTVPVAILSTPTFDATTVDPATVTLEAAAVRLRGNGLAMASLEDVNGDGRLDLIVHVATSDLQITTADTEALLEGLTFGGVPIRGTDAVRIVP